VKELRSIGIQPDLLVSRCDRPISEELKAKIRRLLRRSGHGRDPRP